MKFLVAFNNSRPSKAALELARLQAKLVGAKIVLLTSMEGGTSEKLDQINKTEMELDAARVRLEADGIACETHQLARGMTPGEDIVWFATENDIDHIFMGIQKKSKTQKLLMGSTAQYVILKSNCPVTSTK